MEGLLTEITAPLLTFHGSMAFCLRGHSIVLSLISAGSACRVWRLVPKLSHYICNSEEDVPDLVYVY